MTVFKFEDTKINRIVIERGSFIIGVRIGSDGVVRSVTLTTNTAYVKCVYSAMLGEDLCSITLKVEDTTQRVAQDIVIEDIRTRVIHIGGEQAHTKTNTLLDLASR